jgi:hypothetical protein
MSKFAGANVFDAPASAHPQECTEVLGPAALVRSRPRDTASSAAVQRAGAFGASHSPGSRRRDGPFQDTLGLDPTAVRLSHHGQSAPYPHLSR